MLGLLEEVEPERCLLPPAGRAQADLLGGERLDPEPAGQRLPGGQPDPLAALEVADGQGGVVAAADPGDGLGEVDEAGRQAAVDPLGPLGRRPARQVEQVRPVDRQGGRDRAEAEQVGQQRDRLGVAVHLVAVADLAVAVAEGGVGELERDEGRARGRPVVPGPAGQELAGQASPVTRGRKSSGRTHW